MTHRTTVLALTPSTGGPYFGEVLSGLTREVAAVGGQVVIVQTLGPGGRGGKVLETPDFSTPAAWAEVDGVVAITAAVRAPVLQRLRDAGKPVVVAGERIDGFDAPLALADNHDGTVAAVEHLLSHGHTRIGFVGDVRRPDVQQRYAAYRATLEAAGLPVDPDHVFTGPETSDPTGTKAARAVRRTPGPPSALMVGDDRMAIGLMRALSDAGRAIPRDLAVISFDNIEAAAFSTPPLSSVNQRFDEVGALAGRLVLAAIRGEPVAVRQHISPAAGIALRGSCGCSTATPDGGAPDADAPTMTFWEAPRDELSELLRGALLTYDSTAGGPTEDAVLALAVEVEGLLDAGSSLPADRLDALTESLRQIAPEAVMLHRTVGALTEYLQWTESSTVLASDGTAPPTARVATALWQMQAGSLRGRSSSFEDALDEQAGVVRGLLEMARSHPCRLEWLAGTHVHTGILGLWDDGDPSSGRLRIAGQFDPLDLLPPLLDTTMDVEHFPPASLIDAAEPDERGACIVVPVRTRDRDWGMLALIGEINTISTRETYHLWASLLCTALESERLQAAVRASEERYAHAARATNDGLWEWDARTGDLYLSERFCTMLGLPAAQTRARLSEWESLVHPDDMALMHEVLSTSATGDGEPVQREYRILTPDGTFRWVLARALGVPAADGSIKRVVGSLSDIHERRSLEDKLRENALYDALTGLPNRRLFLDRLERSVALWRRSETPFAVLFLDLDGFKLVNDSLGHPMGDRLLCAVGGRIKRELRTVDTGARFGGDEFAILLHDVPTRNVLLAARRIQAAIAEMIDLDGHEFTVRASLGVATSTAGGGSAEDVLKDADSAMYKAKTTERGSVSFFDAEMHARAAHERRLTEEIRSALDLHQFEVHYQPIVDLASGRTDRFGAVVRWRHPERGLLLPAEFLPTMTEAGLIVPLGHQTIDEVCRQLAAWGPDVVGVAIKLSDPEFWHTDLLPRILEGLARHHLAAERLTLEIPGGVITRRPELALRLIRGLHDAGLRIHVDGFGTGGSSIETLHRFPVQAFTIDRSTISGMTTGTGTDELVGALVIMGRALGLDVAVKGIATHDQLRLAQDVGCATGQGLELMSAVTGDRALRRLGPVLGPRQTGLRQTGQRQDGQRQDGLRQLELRVPRAR